MKIQTILFLLINQSSIISTYSFFSGIYGGHNATEGEYPYIVTLFVRLNVGVDIHYFAGSIIDKRWILSSAECIDV